MVDEEKYMLIRTHTEYVKEIIIEMRKKEAFYVQEVNDIMEAMQKLSKESSLIRMENNKFYKLHCQLQDTINEYKNIGFPIVLLLGMVIGFFMKG